MKNLLLIFALLIIFLASGSCAAPRRSQAYLPFAPVSKHKTIKRMNSWQFHRASQGYTLYHTRNGQIKKR